MRKQIFRFAVLLAMAAALAVSFFQRRAAAVWTDPQCMRECDRRYTYCNAHPDGYWQGVWIGGDCWANETPTFCTTWECPNDTQLYSHCLENPTLPDCDYNIDPNFYYCEDTGASNCYTTCLNKAAQLTADHPGEHFCCADAVVFTTGGTSCSCTPATGHCP